MPWTPLLPADRLVLASNNPGKLLEFQQLFDELALPVQLVTQAELGIAEAEETGLSFIENAILKARHASRESGLPALADDSGLCVPLLNGAPGIYSARFGGTHGDDAQNNQALLDRLRVYRDGRRIEAQFVCMLALVRHAEDPLPLLFQGYWHGEILPETRGKGGFGYDPLFWIPELNKTSSELDPTHKNRISHRGQAMQQFREQLEEYLPEAESPD